ncbi:hypothetical protein [Pseudomonas sp. NPDC089406]|uniref:hypothetical protein n=1 Tax=Pseudomonas sp. NPDC089406 TaxID=3364463 RepID=UPI003850CC24
MNPTTLALTLALLCPLAQAQDKVSHIPVHFAKGASSTEIKGSFKGYDSIQYSLSAKAGQQMSVQIAGSSNANFNVFAPGEKPGSGTALGSGSVGNTWSGKLPASGSYTVQVYQMRASARRGELVPHTLTIGIQ